MVDEPEPAEESPAPATLRDRWWWSPTLNMLAGGGVVAYQWGPITQSKAIPLTWVVAAIGVAVALVGLVRLVRAYPRPSADAGPGPGRG